MADNQLYISDLDGTLLGEDAQLSDYSRRELGRMLREGLPFTVASARSIVSMSAILGELPLVLPIIEFNGGFLTDYRTRERFFCRELEPAIAEALLAHGRESGLPPFVSTYDGAKDRLYAPAPANGGMTWYLEDRRSYRDDRLRETEELERAFDERIVCLTFISRRAALEPLEEFAAREFGDETQRLLYENPYNPGWHWFTIHDRRANKADALCTLAEMKGVALADVTVFGDHINDVPMFQAAGRAIAVANAQETVKPHADETIGPNTTDSVVKYLQKQWNANRNGLSDDDRSG